MGSSLSWQTDTQLHDSVQRQLEWDPHVESHDVAVIASEGVITLAGFVHSSAAKLAAERSVKRVQGVRGVANEIQVAPLTERTDTDIARGAVHALRAHASVPISVKVTARNGYLTLEGQVEWMFEKEAAADAVAHLDGVKDVSNQITVKPGVPVAETKADDRRHDSPSRTRGWFTMEWWAPGLAAIGVADLLVVALWEGSVWYTAIFAAAIAGLLAWAAWLFSRSD
jgi:osmotically-inducible protein OsmY